MPGESRIPIANCMKFEGKVQHEPHQWRLDLESSLLHCPGYQWQEEPAIVEPCPRWSADEVHEAHIWDPPFRTDQIRCPGISGDTQRKSTDSRLDPDQVYQDHYKWAQKRLKEPTTEVVRWADEAMFKAEPIDADEGPKVYLLWMTPDPLGAIAAACKMYKGEVVRDLSTVTDRERVDYLEQIQNTKLKAPFEFVKFHFMIEGVTRAFTHQMVRQRTAVYAQESLRFAVKEDMPVGLPPSLAGVERDPVNGNARDIWDSAIEHLDDAYQSLVNAGVPAEDARGLLPHNVLTRLHYSTDLRALLDHAGNRLCTQAQFEWRLVFAQIAKVIRDLDHHDSVMADGMQAAYMSAPLADLFKPVCYQTGKCEFKANFDRHCNIRERVDAFEANGVPPEKWGESVQVQGPTPWYERDGEEVAYNMIPGIKPGEWLLDHTSARRQGR